LFPPIVLSDLEFLFEYDLTICETSRHGIGESSSHSSHDLLDIELISNEAILEAMISDGRPWEYIPCRILFLPELENLCVDYQRNPWLHPRNGI
jgi:hypothetical protein